MFAEREREAPDPPRRAVPMALVGLGIAALVGAAGVIGATQFGDSERIVPRGGDGRRRWHARTSCPRRAARWRRRSRPSRATTACYSTASVRKLDGALPRAGRAQAPADHAASTEWGSPRVLGVVSQRGDWLGVQASELKNGEIAWLPRDKAHARLRQLVAARRPVQAHAQVRHDGEHGAQAAVAIGRKDNPTPKGRFTVTDRLQVTSSGSPYGCCVLALTGHQTDLPPYWPGGDRLAVHATNDESSIGKPVSLGCMRADSAEARWLINNIPLGAPVFIHS